jgi:hypothetical protein
VVLEPQAGARLVGLATADLPANAKGVVQVTKPDRTTLQGHFR